MAYVYKHIRLDTNEIFYIGIGSDDTYRRSKTKDSRNKYWKNIYNKTKISVVIMFDKISFSDACLIEKELILYYGRFDLKTGPLVNMTGGGEGNYNPSQETRNKIRMSHLGKTFSLDHKKKLSLAKTGKSPWNKGKTGIYTEDVRKKISLSQIGRAISLEHRLKIGNSLRGKNSYKSKKCKNIITGEIFECAKHGAKSISMDYKKFIYFLTVAPINKTPFIYV